MHEFASPFPIRILAVIVLYKMVPMDSATFHSLQTAISHANPEKFSLKILLYDNTPVPADPSTYPVGTYYEAPGQNKGIADAYNRAIDIASEEGFNWLLTLDQDTELPRDFMEKLADTASIVEPMKDVAAIVPLIYDKTTLVSPNAGSYTTFPEQFSEQHIGVSTYKFTSAFNSASTLKVDVLKTIGGYDQRFWLDYSDAVMYHRLQTRGFRVFIAGNIKVQHELSVMDMGRRVSIERYEGILQAESAYCDECMGVESHVHLLIKLVYRTFFKFSWGPGGAPYRKIAFRHLCRRLFYSRSRRLQLWQESVVHRAV